MPDPRSRHCRTVVPEVILCAMITREHCYVYGLTPSHRNPVLPTATTSRPQPISYRDTPSVVKVPTKRRLPPRRRMADIEKMPSRQGFPSKPTEADEAEIDYLAEKKLVRKLDCFLIPVVMLLYLLSFLDRSVRNFVVYFSENWVCVCLGEMSFSDYCFSSSCWNELVSSIHKYIFSI